MMDATKFITPDEAEAIRQALEASTKLQIILTNAVAAGFPFQEHLDKSREQNEWLTKILAMWTEPSS